MQLLLNFPTVVQVMVVVVVFGAGGLYLVRRHVSLQELKENHDVLGFTFTVVGAFYGVVLAFVTVAAWQQFQNASEREQSEALSLGSLYTVSMAYPDPARARIHDYIRVYALDALHNQWPAMGSYAYVQDASDMKRIWDALFSINPATAKEQILLAKGVDLMT